MSHLRDPNKPNAQHGFTLVELLISIAIMSILATLAAPSVTDALAKQRIDTAGNALLTALRSAKSESLLHREDIHITYDDMNKKIQMINSKGNAISTYPYYEEITITSEPNTTQQVTFTAQKSATPITYKICYNNRNQGIQIQVSSIANITATGVSCP